jgi:hypothetical protein
MALKAAILPALSILKFFSFEDHGGKLQVDSCPPAISQLPILARKKSLIHTCGQACV